MILLQEPNLNVLLTEEGIVKEPRCFIIPFK